MQVAYFKIEPAVEEVKQVEKVETYAGLYFSVKVNGQEIAMPGSTPPVVQDNLQLHLGSGYSHEITSARLYFPAFGEMYAKSVTQSKLLLEMKPKLEAAFRQHGEALTGQKSAIAKKDLLTDKPLLEDKRDVVLEYAFIDPTMEIVTETVKQPSRIFFICLAPWPEEKTITGHAGGLEVLYGRGTGNGWGGISTLYFNSPGWITTGVDAMRAKFPDEVITAAFKDLAQKLVEAEPTPEDAVRWSASKATKVELVK